MDGVNLGLVAVHGLGCQIDRRRDMSYVKEREVICVMDEGIDGLNPLSVHVINVLGIFLHFCKLLESSSSHSLGDSSS